MRASRFRYQFGMRVHWVCRFIGHRWGVWSPIGHIEDAEWRKCDRGCQIGQMRYG